MSKFTEFQAVWLDTPSQFSSRITQMREEKEKHVAWILALKTNDGVLYWADHENYNLTQALSRAKRFPSELGAQHELNHLPSYSPYDKLVIVETEGET